MAATALCISSSSALQCVSNASRAGKCQSWQNTFPSKEAERSPNLMSRICSLLLDRYGSSPPLGCAMPLLGRRLYRESKACAQLWPCFEPMQRTLKVTWRLCLSVRSTLSKPAGFASNLGPSACAAMLQ